VDRLILVRHGETAYTAEGLLNPDDLLDAPLSPGGEEAAREFGRDLAAEPVTIAVTSPRLRARRTAQLLAAGRDLPLLELEDLAEVHAGAFAGGPVTAYRQWLQSAPLAAAPPGGESVLAAADRYLAGLRRIARLPEPVVLAVMHNLPMRMALNAAAGADPVAGPVRALPHLARRELATSDLERAISALATWRAGAAAPRSLSPRR
jgi:probable phosphoglycerate mutase